MLYGFHFIFGLVVVFFIETYVEITDVKYI